MSTTKPGGITAPPLTLDDDDDNNELFAGLRKTARPPLSPDAKTQLQAAARTSPLVTTRSHRPEPAPVVAPPPEKVVRDAFTMPRQDHETLRALDQAALRQGFDIGKSGVVRLGIRLLATLPPEQFRQLVAELPPVPTRKLKR